MAGKAIKHLSAGGAGQSLSDRMTSAKHIITGSGLGRAVCKATTEEIIAPKKKHLGYLIECTNQSNVSIPELANALLERLSSSNWVVVFKALVSIHSVMNYGNERFTQYLASNNCNLSLRSFYDKSSVQGADMSRFICRYSAYVQEKAFAYRSLAYDLCKVKRGSDDGVLRTLSVEKLLRALPVLIAQFDALLGFDATPGELSNAIINAAFLMLYKDASRLFVVFNDGIINLLSNFFESMNRKQCREGLDLYKKFLVRSERLSEFSRVAESAGVDRADVANLERHPTSFLEAMESHLAQLEGRRVSRSDSSNSISSAASPAPAASVAPASASSSSVSEAQRQVLLMEEQRQLDKLKAERQRQLASSGGQAASKPQPSEQPAQQQKSSNEDNLLLLDSTPATTSAAAFTPFPPQQPAAAFSPFSTASFSAFPPAAAFPAAYSVAPGAAYSAAPTAYSPAPTAFSPAPTAYSPAPIAFSAAPAAYSPAYSPAPTAFSAAPAAYSPAPTAFSAAPVPVSASSVFDPFGGVLEPTRPSQPKQQQQQQQQASSASRSGLTGDLDSSLAALAGRLDVRGPSAQQLTAGGAAGRQGINWTHAGGGGGAALANSSRTGGSLSAPVPIAPGPTVNWSVGGMAMAGQPRFAMQQQQQFGPAYVAGPFGQPVYGLQQQQWQSWPANQNSPGLPPGQQNGSGPSDPFGAL